MKTWRSRLFLVVALMLAVFVVACSGGDDAPRTEDDFGFLAIPTQTPVPTITPISPEEREELCPALPENVTFSVGQHINLYDTLILENSEAISVFHSLSEDWILGENVDPVLSLLDREITQEPWDISHQDIIVDVRMKQPGNSQCGPGAGPYLFIIDRESERIGLPQARTQAPLPAGFVEQLLLSFSDVDATAEPRPTLAPYTPGPTSTPIFVPDDAPFFDHPEDELRWAGPDDRVYSRTRQHCAAPDVLREEFGIPDLIAVEDGNGYWAIGAVPPPSGLHWTGYFHDGWEIWQGEDPKTIYLLHDELDDIAFEYENFGCI